MSRHFFGKALLITGATFLSIAPSWAQSADPPMWTVVSNGSGGFIGQNFLFNNEVNKLGTTDELGLYIQGGSPNKKDFNPFYLILGFVNQGTPFSAPTITTVNVYDNAGNPDSSGNLTSPGAKTTFSGLTLNPLGSVNATFPDTGSTTLPLSWTGTPADPYDALKLGGESGGTNSENFTNWSAAESQIGITASSFLLEVYNLSTYSNNTSFTGNGLIDVTFNETLAKGTFAVGYACGPTNCSSTPNPFANPFTQSGMTTGGGGGNQVPEPSSILLLGTVTLIVARIGRKKLQRS